MPGNNCTRMRQILAQIALMDIYVHVWYIYVRILLRLYNIRHKNRQGKRGSNSVADVK